MLRLDEWRVWVTQRTPDEIRENMFKRLNGRESGLAALWNFDDPDEPGRDASPHGFHGIVTTGANAAPGTLPNAIQGIVTDKDGRAVPNAEITFERGGTRVASTTTDFLGKYLYLGAGLDQPVTINARQGELSCEPVEVTPNGPLELNLKLRDLARLSGRTLALDESPIPSVVVQALPVADENEASTNSEPGLQVELFALAELKGFPTVTASLTPKLQRVDPQIDFPLGTGSVAPVEFDSACFARWTGALRIEAARKYTFHLRAKSQARLFIDGALVAQSTFQAPLAGIATDIANISKAEGAGAVTLSSGFHALKVEFYNAHGRSACQLFWSAERLPREIVPARVLFRNSTITARPTMATTISDANGKFRFYDLAAGKYTLRAQLPGRFMELDNGRVITLEKDQPVLNQDFKFAPFKKGVWRHLSRLDGLAEDNRNHAVEVGEAHAKVAKHAKGIETLKGIQGQPNSEAAT